MFPRVISTTTALALLADCLVVSAAAVLVPTVSLLSGFAAWGTLLIVYGLARKTMRWCAAFICLSLFVPLAPWLYLLWSGAAFWLAMATAGLVGPTLPIRIFAIGALLVTLLNAVARGARHFLLRQLELRARRRWIEQLKAYEHWLEGQVVNWQAQISTSDER